MDREISPSPVNDNALLNLPLCSLDTLSWPQHIYLPIRGSRLGRRKHSVTFEAFQRLKRTSLFSTFLKASPPPFFFSEMWLAGDGVTQWNIHERGEQISKWTPMSSRNSPSLHHQQSLSHTGWGNLIDPLLNYFFALFHFNRTHWQVVWS